jgi:GlpG protein
VRAIGKIDSEAHARRFLDYLYARGLGGQVDPARDGQWTVYVHAEDDLAPASEAFERFLANPDDPAYATAQSEAEARRREAARDDDAYAKRQVDPRRRWQGARGGAPLTIGLILASIAVGLYTNLGENLARDDALFAASALDPSPGWLPEVARGQVWRLLTPIFLHFGIMHLLFNMWWLWDLGRILETRRSALELAALVLVIGVGTNVANYAWYGPLAGGMSGVIYGLLGYVWIRGRFDPGSGVFAPGQAVGIMIVWMGLCLTGLMGPVANVAHVGGLAMGMAWGFVSAKGSKRTRA